MAGFNIFMLIKVKTRIAIIMIYLFADSTERLKKALQLAQLLPP